MPFGEILACHSRSCKGDCTAYLGTIFNYGLESLSASCLFRASRDKLPGDLIWGLNFYLGGRLLSLKKKGEQTITCLKMSLKKAAKSVRWKLTSLWQSSILWTRRVLNLRSNSEEIFCSLRKEGSSVRCQLWKKNWSFLEGSSWSESALKGGEAGLGSGLSKDLSWKSLTRKLRDKTSIRRDGVYELKYFCIENTFLKIAWSLNSVKRKKTKTVLLYGESGSLVQFLSTGQYFYFSESELTLEVKLAVDWLYSWLPKNKGEDF